MARQVLTVPDVPGALLTEAEGDARYPLKVDANPYPQYVTDAELATALAPYSTTAQMNTAISAAITTHAGAADPHPGYATDADLTAHAGAADPHTVYYNQARGDARYLQPATAASTYVPLAGGSVMTGALGPTTTNSRDLGTSTLRWRKDWVVDGDYSGSLVVAVGLTVAAKAVALSPNANQTLQWLANGFFHDGPAKATYDALVARVGTLETKVAALEVQMGAGAGGHYHNMGTWRQTNKAVIPVTLAEEVPVG